MSNTTTGTVREQIGELFQKFGPVLVEARFPKMATSPDWYLFEDEQQFERLLARLGPTVELHVSSVWDLTNDKGEVVVTRAELKKDGK
jgi:hypothetical protein